MTPEYRPLVGISGVVRHVDHPLWERIMSIAVFKPIEDVIEEGEKVWGKLFQKVISRDELAAHKDAGWIESAADAIEAHDLKKMEAENAKLQEQIAAEQVRLDGRTKAAKDLKAKSGNVVATAEIDSSLSQNSMQTADESQTSATPPDAPAA